MNDVHLNKPLKKIISLYSITKDEVFHRFLTYKKTHEKEISYKLLILINRIDFTKENFAQIK